MEDYLISNSLFSITALQALPIVDAAPMMKPNLVEGFSDSSRGHEISLLKLHWSLMCIRVYLTIRSTYKNVGLCCWLPFPSHSESVEHLSLHMIKLEVKLGPCCDFDMRIFYFIIFFYFADSMSLETTTLLIYSSGPTFSSGLK